MGVTSPTVGDQIDLYPHGDIGPWFIEQEKIVENIR